LTEQKIFLQGFFSLYLPFSCDVPFERKAPLCSILDNPVLNFPKKKKIGIFFAGSLFFGGNGVKRKLLVDLRGF
jgi:hypothetical protein